MGLGGDLLWTPALRALHARNGTRITLCDCPKFSDILAGVYDDRASKRRLSPVFENNPFVEFPAFSDKGPVSRLLDCLGGSLINRSRLKNRIENACYQRSQRLNFSSLYLDLPQHSYVAKIVKNRYVWKPGGHIIDIIGASVGLSSLPHECEMHFTPAEEQKAKELVSSLGHDRYITIEPETNTEYFGELRSWPFERWQEVVNWTINTYAGVGVVQLGVQGARRLNGSINMCGSTSFREAALLIRSSRLFLGTEGGLMHCANAVKAQALILWGGLTDPSFAAYPEKHSVIHHPVNCAPCGLLGHCPNSRDCMLSITTSEVIAALDKLLNQFVPGARR